MNQSYAHPSHVELRETAAPHPARDELPAHQAVIDRRRRRAAKARLAARRRNRAIP